MARMPTSSQPADGTALALRHSAEALTGAFPPLLIAAERIANAVVHGAHGRRRAGPGEDFWQYRRYSPGDAAQQIDWRKSARSRRVLIRENEWEATNTLWLWASQHAGMHYRSKLSDTSKHDRAVTLALAVAILAVRAGERVAAIGTPMAPGNSDLTVNRIAAWYASRHEDDQPALPPSTALPRFSTCLLIGDFFSPLDEISKCFASLAAAGIAGHVVQVVDPAEETFPYEGHTEFVEYRGSSKLPIGKPQTLRDAYRQKFLAHRTGLADLARRLGWTFMVHHSNEPAGRCLMPLYGALSRDDRVHSTAPGGA